MNRSDVERALDTLAETCIISETPEGVSVEPKTRWNQDEFPQLYDVIKKLGGRYLAAQVRFIILSKETVPAGLQKETFKIVPLGLLEPLPFAARIEISEEAIAELAETIKTHGVLEPLLVRPFGAKYQVVCGMRRLKAAERGLRS